MKFKVLIVASIILVILTLGAVSASDNITDEVSQSEDGEVLEDAVAGNTFDDIQKTVSSCSEGAVVELNGVYTSSKSPITITKSITIDGHGATLNANKKSSILKVTSKNLTLKNIKFTNSKDVAIYSKNCNLEIINCTFTNNGGELAYEKYELFYYVTCDYGCINAIGGKLTLINSSFSGNLADAGMCVEVHDGQLNAINNTFSNHNSKYKEGYIIQLYNSKSSLYNCTFKNNTETMFDTDTGAVINNCLFDNNYRGLACCNPKSTVINVYNSTFKRTNQFSIKKYYKGFLNIRNCKFISNLDSTILYNYDVNITDCEFIQNTAKKGSVLNGGGHVSVLNSTFIENSAKYGGTFFSQDYLDYKEKYDNSLTIINSTVKDSSSSSNGGAIYARCCDVVVINTNISTKSSSAGSQIYLIVSTFNSINSTHDNITKIDKIPVELVEVYPMTTRYDSRRFFSLCMNTQDATGSPQLIDVVKVMFKVYTGSKYKVYYYTPKKDNSASGPGFKIDSSLSLGKHKVEIICNSNYYKFTTKTTTLTIKKAEGKVTAKKITAKYKKDKYFKITVKNRLSLKYVGNIKIKVKVFTGKKSKSFTLKTDKNGVAKLNTKSLKRGKHKVVITSKNKNYDISQKSTIKIK